ncbi:unnamed protein product [Durusdinium trenchii]|uniref:Uncharacterized protein n=4 Tax=Durusdinium trenchii TaxID=1381693 RepID=A0ABP0HPT8_9DINO
MNVVIPLGGVGSRFQTEGYLTRPKPFIPVLGKPMIRWVVDNLSLSADDTLVVIYNPAWMSMKNFMEEQLADRDSRVRLVELPGPTRGAAETVLIGLKSLPEDMLKRPTLLADGDTFYTADVVSRFRAVAKTHNAVFCFKDTQPKPIYSYIKLDIADNIKEVKEKIKISDWANTGCYCFRDGAELAQECEALIRRGETQLSQDQKGEFYTSGVIAAMIARGAPFRGIKLDREDFHVLGTPTQVAEWCAKWPNQPKMRFVFDLYGTLVTENGKAIERNLRLCRSLKKQGHHVAVWTERPAEEGAATLDLLQSLGVEYHELHFGKVVGDFYIDDRGVDPILGDLEKQIGFYQTEVKVQEARGSHAAARLRMGAAVAAPKPSKESMIGFAVGLSLGLLVGYSLKNRS